MLSLQHQEQGIDGLFSPFLFNSVLQILVNVVKQEKAIKGIQIRKEEGKLSLSYEIYRKKVLALIIEYSKIAGFKVNTNIESFYVLPMNNQKLK